MPYQSTAVLSVCNHGGHISRKDGKRTPRGVFLRRVASRGAEICQRSCRAARLAPDPETVRRSVPSAWPGSWAGNADSSGLTQLSTSIFHFPVETGYRCTIGLSGWPSDMPAGRTQHCPSVCAGGMAGQLGWECRQ